MKYLAVLGRQPEISIAELEALFGNVHKISRQLASFMSSESVDIAKLGGTLKLAVELEQKPLNYMTSLPNGKITVGVSDYSKGASQKTATLEALKLKKILVRHGRSVRVVANKDAMLSTATSLHNGLGGRNEKKIEFIKLNGTWYRVTGVQDIDAYARRDQARPARDAKVGMLPPKLAQILINLCGPLSKGSVVLDPFCGTGVVLQEALLMGYQVYGTDISERMTEYSSKNLKWLTQNYPQPIESSEGETLSRVADRNNRIESYPFRISPGDATNFKWDQPIDAVACEGYLGKPFSRIPAEIEFKRQQQECRSIMISFLKNLSRQIASDTPVTVAIPAWLRPNGTYERLGIFSTNKKVDEIGDMGYNVSNKSREGLLYYRNGQIVARDIIILRKK